MPLPKLSDKRSGAIAIQIYTAGTCCWSQRCPSKKELSVLRRNSEIFAVAYGSNILLSSFIRTLLKQINTFFFPLSVGPEKPRTLTPEWQADSVKKAKRLKSNPISGIASEP